MIATRRHAGNRVLAGAVLAMVGLVGVFAQAAPPAKPANGFVPDSRLTIPVLINGTGPYPFIVDTGSDRTVISAELASSLKLPPGPHVTLHDISSVSDIATVAIDRLSFGSRDMVDLHAPVLAMAGLGAAGMLGLDGLHNQHIVMDFRAATVTAGPSHREEDFNAVIVEGRRRFGQLILVDAQSHGEPIYVILDSGGEATIGNSALRTLIANGDARTARPPTAQIVSATGHHTETEIDTISEIRLDSIIIRNVPIDFADLHIFDYLRIGNRPAMLLGMDVLRHFWRVSVDFRLGEAVFLAQ
jgi:hypothetical protein